MCDFSQRVAVYNADLWNKSLCSISVPVQQNLIRAYVKKDKLHPYKHFFL